MAAEYDSYGFRLVADGSGVKREPQYSVPDIVERTRTHKWERMLDTFALTPKERVRALLEEGVPDAIRPRVWAALIDRSRADSYRKLLLMPDNKSVEQIKLDIGRTFTHHRMFEEKLGEGQQKLLRLLKAYSYQNPAVGYCQGMSYLAGILLTVIADEELAYAGLCQVVGGIEGYFVPTMWELLEDSKVFKLLLEAELNDVQVHLANNGVLPLMFMCKYFMTMFSQLPWPTMLRVFDLYLHEGKTALFRFGLGILAILRDELLALGSIDKLLPFLLEPESRKLSPHILVPYVVQMPVESMLRTAIASYRDEQASLHTPVRRAPPQVAAVAPATAVSSSSRVDTSSVSSGNATFFQRFMDSVATPIRSTIKRRIDPNSGRVVATPPPAAKRAFAFSPMSPGAVRVNSPNRAAVNDASTPPMFKGMTKRPRDLGGLRGDDEDSEPVASPFGSAKRVGLMSPAGLELKPVAVAASPSGKAMRMI